MPQLSRSPVTNYIHKADVILECVMEIIILRGQTYTLDSAAEFTTFEAIYKASFFTAAVSIMMTPTPLNQLS